MKILTKNVPFGIQEYTYQYIAKIHFVRPHYPPYGYEKILSNGYKPDGIASEKQRLYDKCSPLSNGREKVTIKKDKYMDRESLLKSEREARKLMKKKSAWDPRSEDVKRLHLENLESKARLHRAEEISEQASDCEACAALREKDPNAWCEKHMAELLGF